MNLGKYLFHFQVRKQLADICHSAGVKLESSRDMDMVRQALAAGWIYFLCLLTQS